MLSRTVVIRLRHITFTKMLNINPSSVHLAFYMQRVQGGSQPLVLKLIIETHTNEVSGQEMTTGDIT